MTNKRKISRKKTSNYLVVYNMETGNLIGRVLNLTPDGTKLLSESIVKTGVTFNCRMTLPDVIEGSTEIYFNAKSIWCEENRVAEWFETGYEFTNLQHHTQRVLAVVMRDWMSQDEQVSDDRTIINKWINY